MIYFSTQILGFVFLFTVSFLLINDPIQDLEAPQKAEYMAILQWDGDQDIDIRSLDGRTKVWLAFEPAIGYVLDKDDLGHRNDIIHRREEKRRASQTIKKYPIFVAFNGRIYYQCSLLLW